jgi:hypothetical protein
MVSKPLKFCTIDTKTYASLLLPVLLLLVLKEWWCQVPEESEIVTPKHVGVM